MERKLSFILGTVVGMAIVLLFIGVVAFLNMAGLVGRIVPVLQDLSEVQKGVVQVLDSHKLLPTQ